MKKWFLVIFYSLFLISCSTPCPQNDHFNGKQFHNPQPPNDPNLKKNIFYVFELLIKDWKRWPHHVQNRDHPQVESQVNKNETYITFINHSTQLIQLHEINIITDPIFSKRASPYSWVGPKRVRDPGIAFDNLPNIDVVLISHNHYDHFDVESLKKLNQNHHSLFIVPLNNASILKKVGIKNFIEMDWWQTYKLSPHHSVTLVPAQHWSTRSLLDVNRSLWGGYFIQADDLKILFAGDTGYGRHIPKIREKLGEMDICFLPIGCYEAHNDEAYNHFNPEEAVKSHIILGPKLSIGMHFGTFRLSDEKYFEPVQRLNSELKKYHISHESFIAPWNGKTTYYKKPEDQEGR